MVNPKVVQKQLEDARCNFSFFGRPELRELPRILQDGEVIAQCVNGFYEGGFATLCVTNQRLLIVDRKAFSLTVEDIRFDMMSEIDHSSGLFSSTTKLYTPNKSLEFRSFDQGRLQKAMDYLQQRVSESRRQQGEPGAPARISGPARRVEEELTHVASPQQSTESPSPAAHLALRALDRYIEHVPHTSLPLFRRRRYPSFYTIR